MAKKKRRYVTQVGLQNAVLGVAAPSKEIPAAFSLLEKQVDRLDGLSSQLDSILTPVTVATPAKALPTNPSQVYNCGAAARLRDLADRLETYNNRLQNLADNNQL